MNIRKSSGLYIVLMAGWVAPLFVIALVRFPMTTYILSYIPFITTFLIFGLFGCLVNAWDQVRRSGAISVHGRNISFLMVCMLQEH